MRLTTIEIVPSIDFQKALLDLQMSKGYFVYPTYSIQGQQVDIQTQNISTPIDAAGSRIEFTDMTFINEGSVQIGTIPANATLKANSDYLWSFNELLLTSAAQAARNPLLGGGKHIRFLPKINKLSIEIAGQEYPGCSTFDNISSNPQRAYKFYKEMFKDEDQELVPLRDWMFRFFKLRFDYRGQLGLFDKAAQVVDDSGVDTNISTVRLKLEIAHALNAGADLKAFVHHYVPASLLFYPKGQMIKRVY